LAGIRTQDLQVKTEPLLIRLWAERKLQQDEQGLRRHTYFSTLQPTIGILKSKYCEAQISFSATIARNHCKDHCKDHCKEPLQGTIARNHCKDHCKEPLQGLLQGPLQGTTARNHCKEPLQGTTARNHCKEPLQGTIARTIARNHCKEPLQGTIARNHCKEPLQGTIARNPQIVKYVLTVLPAALRYLSKHSDILSCW